MKSIYSLVYTTFLLGISLNIIAQRRPEWVDNLPQYPGTCFKFVLGHGSYEDKGLAQRKAEADAINQLADYVGNHAPTEISEDIKIINGKQGISIEKKVSEIIQTTGGKYLTGFTRQEAPYFEKRKGIYECWILYVQESCNEHLPDNAYPRRKAGLRAVVPSWAQFYKQQPLKGSLILGGVALIAAGYGASLSNENYYQKQANLYNTNATQFSNFIQQRDDWHNTKTGVLIVGGGLLFAYNVIDAIVKKGPRDYSGTPVVNKKISWSYWNVRPYGAISHAGFSVSYSLSPNR
ncbi:hypothetical protein [Spirosoma litoris]